MTKASPSREFNLPFTTSSILVRFFPPVHTNHLFYYLLKYLLSFLLFFVLHFFCIKICLYILHSCIVVMDKTSGALSYSLPHTPQNRRPDDESQISNNTQQIPSFKIFYNYVLKKMVFWEFVIRYSDYFKLCISKDDSKNNLALCLARRHCDLRLQHRSLHHVPVGNGQLRM